MFKLLMFLGAKLDKIYETTKLFQGKSYFINYY